MAKMGEIEIIKKIKERHFRRGDFVEWTETRIEYLNECCFPYPDPFPPYYPHGFHPYSKHTERHTGKITHLPKDMENGFLGVRDDEDGTMHLLPADRLTLLREKVKFDLRIEGVP